MKNVGYILFSFFLCLFVSCKKDTASIPLLTEAQKTVESKPSEALALLDSIADPQSMDQDNYMQYVVTRVQARYALKQDVTGDTLIFEAQKYFNNTNNSQQAALAGYYTGIVNRELKRYDQSLISFLKSADYAKKASDNKLSGKIFDYMGYVYLEQDLPDSAIVNYQKAINYYTIDKNAPYILRATNQIGRAYEGMNKLDSAYLYFNKTLQIAENLNDEEFKSKMTQNLGVVSFGMGEYDKAITYLQSALSMKATDAERVRQINQLLLKTFNKKNDLSSAKEYAAKVEANLPEVTDLYTIRIMYATLADYYTKTGDYKRAMDCTQQQAEAVKQIAKQERPEAMIQAHGNFFVDLESEKYDQAVDKFVVYMLFTVGIFVAAVCVLFLFFIRHYKKQKEEDLREIEKYTRLRERLASLSNKDYDAQLDAEIKAILEEDTEEETEK